MLAVCEHNVHQSTHTHKHMNTNTHRTTVAGLEKRYIPDPKQVTCTSGTAGPIRLSFTNVSGLLILTFVVLFLGLGIGKFFARLSS